MASGVDPVATLRQALTLPTDSPEQANILSTLRETLETVPSNVPVLLLRKLVPGVQGQGDSLFKQWVFDLVWYCICRAPMSIQERTRLALEFIDPLRDLLADPNPFYMKLAIQTLGAIYPHIFRLSCADPSQLVQWTKMVDVRNRVMDYSVHPTTPLGVRLAAIKFLQRVILVHSKGVSDPRLQNPNDPHLLFVPANHPFLNVPALEAEGHKVTEQCLLTFWNSRNPDVITALIQSFGIIAKQRPDLVAFVYTAFVEWKSSNLVEGSQMAIRSIYKTMRIALSHFNRTHPQGQHRAEVENAIRKLDLKLHEALAHAEEIRRKRELSIDDTIPMGDAKRIKTSINAPETSKAHRPVDPAILANFDFSTVPRPVLVDIIVESLKLLSEAQLQEAIEKWKATNAAVEMAIEPPPQEETMEDIIIKAEPIDPLNLDLEEDLNLETTTPNLDVTEPAAAELGISTFKLPRPRPMSEKQRGALVDSCLLRVQSRGREHDLTHKSSEVEYLGQRGKPTPEMWILLLVRMITRGSWSSADVEEEIDEEDAETKGDEIVKPNGLSAKLDGEYRMRKMLFNYIIMDFTARHKIATLWLNEEWHNDQVRLKRSLSARVNYDYWLKELLRPAAERGDRESFSEFVLDLPELPPEVLELLRELAAEKSRMPTAMAILRPLIELRIPMRKEAMTVLLELMTHPSEATRKGAIHTVRRWWPDVEPMATRIREYTTLSLERLAAQPESESESTSDSESSLGPYLPSVPTLPADKNEITQYLEGSLALSVKDPSFLSPLFQTYSRMDPSVQEAVQELLVRPIHAIGPNNMKLLGYLKDYPEGAEGLVLRILNVFVEGGRPGERILALVKSLIADRGADARFLMLIISEMDKAEIIRHLPKLVGTLNGTPERRTLVRQMFASIVEVTQVTNTNQVREGQSRLLTPKELMIQLHDMESEVGLQKAKEAISICFNMPDIFKSEVLASVMQHYLDTKVLPMLFVWTVLQAVATYKHLTGWVSTTLLSRLIIKKVWTIQRLWDGFILLAERTEPNSFDTLLQLPKEQLRDLAEKKPAMKVKLRDWLTKKAGKNKAKYGGFFEVLGDETAVA